MTLAHKRGAPGFTLLEMMLVVVIIGLLAGVAVFAIGRQGATARIETTKAKMAQVKSAVQTYQLSTGQYPASLQNLVPQYLEKVPTDSWNNPLYYNAQTGDPNRPFHLVSRGEDAQLDTPDDIDIWRLDAPAQPSGTP